jgi:hypothetical protein
VLSPSAMRFSFNSHHQTRACKDQGTGVFLFA